MTLNRTKISWKNARREICSAPCNVRRYWRSLRVPFWDTYFRPTLRVCNVKSYWRSVKAALYEVKLTSEKEFMSLVWHEIDDSRLLTPSNCPRTMADVVDRLLEKGYSFEDLSQDMDLPSNQHKPKWFRRCCEIYNNFSYDKFKRKPIWLRPLNHGEKDQSPQGNFYILDGCHRALVLAKLLRENKIQYEPFNPILIWPKTPKKNDKFSP